SQQLTREGTILGTPAYMSPEQARGRAIDPRSDLWSFGCLLYEMLTARLAFGRETIPDCLAAILHEEPDWKRLPRSTPAAVRRLLQRCLEKEPERRISAAGEVRAELRSAQEKPARTRRSPATVSRATPRLTQLTLSRGLEEGPAFSPEGGALAYAADSEGVR